MKIKNYFRVLLAITVYAAIIAFSWQSLAEDKEHPGLGAPKIHEIKGNVIAVTGLYHSPEKGFSVNAGIVLTKKSIIFIDSGMTIASAEFLQRTAKERMPNPEHIYLILTHHHSDHTFGMRVFKDRGAKIIAHRMVRRWLHDDKGRYKRFIIEMSGWDEQKGDEILGDVALSEPDQLIDKDTVLRIDDEEVHVFATPGHVISELSVYHPKSQTLFAGDTIYEGTKLTTRFGGPREWKLWISQLERLKQLEINTIVPGHGKLCSKEEIDRNISYLRGLL